MPFQKSRYQALQHFDLIFEFDLKDVITSLLAEDTHCYTISIGILQKLVGWLFNGTSTQKDQFVPTAGQGNRLSRLRMANEIQCIFRRVARGGARMNVPPVTVVDTIFRCAKIDMRAFHR